MTRSHFGSSMQALQKFTSLFAVVAPVLGGWSRPFVSRSCLVQPPPHTKAVAKAKEAVAEAKKARNKAVTTAKKEMKVMKEEMATKKAMTTKAVAKARGAVARASGFPAGWRAGRAKNLTSISLLIALGHFQIVFPSKCFFFGRTAKPKL